MGDAAKRLLAKRGETVTVREWTEGTVDPETGDTTGDTLSTRTVKAIRESPNRPQTERGPSGQEVVVDLIWYLADGDEPAVTAGERVNQIEDPEGSRYEVVDVGGLKLGLRPVATSRMR